MAKLAWDGAGAPRRGCSSCGCCTTTGLELLWVLHLALQGAMKSRLVDAPASVVAGATEKKSAHSWRPLRRVGDGGAAQKVACSSSPAAGAAASLAPTRGPAAAGAAPAPAGPSAASSASPSSGTEVSVSCSSAPCEVLCRTPAAREARRQAAGLAKGTGRGAVCHYKCRARRARQADR